MVSQYWLPWEVWAMVFQVISKEVGSSPVGSSPASNLKNVRLTCRTFEELATPFLLPQPRIICGSFSSSLARLTAVSQHPVFSRSITEFVCVCNRYQFIKTPLEYKVALRTAEQSWDKFEERKSEEENYDLEKAFSQHRQAYTDQVTMENSGETIACICSALMRMPRIKTITITPVWDFLLERECYTGNFPEPDPEYNQAFLLMVRVISLTNTKIQCLSIDHGNDSCKEDVLLGVDGELFRGMSNINLNHCCNSFRSLRDIEIATHETDEDGWMTGHLAKILSGAIDLEKLSLHSCYRDFPISTKYILNTKTWNRLASLNFMYVIVDQTEILDLLRRHSGTLKHIGVYRVRLTNGLWRIFLGGLKSSLSLRHISIDGPSDEEGHVFYLNQIALENYLLSDGAHPLSE